MSDHNLTRRRRLVLAIAGLVLLALLTGARHRVRVGETYGTLAIAYDVEEALLRSVNPKVTELTPGVVITIPESPARHRWSPAHPFAPPAPTLSQLLQDIEQDAVKVAVVENHPDTFAMYAGPSLDIEIGRAKKRTVIGKTEFVVYLYVTVGRADKNAWKSKRAAPRQIRLGRTSHFAGMCDCGALLTPLRKDP